GTIIKKLTIGVVGISTAFLTRHREDRPIEDARWWARFALFIALIALASSLVSAIADFSNAR
ncbi:MAG TPA: hypothetical protein VKD43_12860, partial [Xanthobacteraceae bacterium]|nr:hypothetical protein [Xanthobacteraceae bacterium]